MKKNVFIIMGISSLALLFSACGKGSVDGADIEVKVVDGYVKNAEVTDNVGQVARYSSNGTYFFDTNPIYPIKSSGGKLEDTDVAFDIDMQVSDGITKVISPITTFLGTDSALLTKFAGLNLGISTLDEFSVDYIAKNNLDLAKLAQLLYLIQRDSTLSTNFKTSVENNSSLSSLDNMFALAETSIDSSSYNAHEKSQIKSLLKAAKNYSGEASKIESSLEAFKYNLVTRGETNISHNGISYGTIKSPHTGKIWLDRNIGASQVCTSRTDTKCYGDYFQWGRNADGHEKFTSGTTSTKATSISNVGHGNFITTASTANTQRWASVDTDFSQRVINWSKTDGSSVCPVGYRVPTQAEISAETINLTGDDAISNATDVFNSFLGLPSAGYRKSDSGTRSGVGTSLSLSTTTLGTISVRTYDAGSNQSEIWANSTVAYGISVRCIQD